MTKFLIQGNIAEVCAGLKATLDAQDANFKAQLNAAVKLAPPQRAQVEPVSLPQAANGSVLSTTNRNRRFAR